jgi:signal transduction histidine kinase
LPPALADFERISGGRLVLVQQPFSLRRLLDAVRTTFAGLAASKSIALAVNALPAALTSVALVGDERRLQQCLNNGVSNAIKFTEPGGTITLSASVLDDVPLTPPPGNSGSHEARSGGIDSGVGCKICLRIEDDGIGLTAAELVALNSGEAFVQVGRGQLQGNGGTGLGLTIVRHILDLHDSSSLAIESDGSGCGTRFCLNLNLKLAPNTTGDGAAGAASAPVDGSRVRSHRVSADDMAVHRVAPVPLAVLREGGPLVFRPGFRLLYVEVRAAADRSREQGGRSARCR